MGLAGGERDWDVQYWGCRSWMNMAVATWSGYHGLRWAMVNGSHSSKPSRVHYTFPPLLTWYETRWYGFTVYYIRKGEMLTSHQHSSQEQNLPQFNCKASRKAFRTGTYSIKSWYNHTKYEQRSFPPKEILKFSSKWWKYWMKIKITFTTRIVNHLRRYDRPPFSGTEYLQPRWRFSEIHWYQLHRVYNPSMYSSGVAANASLPIQFCFASQATYLHSFRHPLYERFKQRWSTLRKPALVPSLRFSV